MHANVGSCWEAMRDGWGGLLQRHGRAAQGNMGCCVGGVARRDLGRRRDVGWTRKWNNALLDQGWVGGCGLAMGGAGSRWDRPMTQDGRKAVRLQLFADGWRIMEGGAERKTVHHDSLQHWHFFQHITWTFPQPNKVDKIAKVWPICTFCFTLPQKSIFSRTRMY